MHASGESDVNQVGPAAERLAVPLLKLKSAKVTLFSLSSCSCAAKSRCSSATGRCEQCRAFCFADITSAPLPPFFCHYGRVNVHVSFRLLSIIDVKDKCLADLWTMLCDVLSEEK
jgi:hypothetical protein